MRATTIIGSLYIALATVSVVGTTSFIFLFWKLGLRAVFAERTQDPVLDQYYPWEKEVSPRVLLLKRDALVETTLNTTEDGRGWGNTSPPGRGVVRLGPDRRAFLVSMFHQLHCLEYLREGLMDDSEDISWPHVQHCLNMLRQWILCRPDTSLEPGNFVEQDFSINRTARAHLCHDWENVYNVAKENWVEWYKYRVEHNITFDT